MTWVRTDHAANSSTNPEGERFYPLSISNCVCCAAFDTLSSFARGSQPGPSCQEQFQHALMTWQHPESSLPGAAVSALAGSKAGQGMLDARKAAWQEAFRSLFMALRSGACSAFYLVTAQVGFPELQQTQG